MLHVLRPKRRAAGVECGSNHQRIENGETMALRVPQSIESQGSGYQSRMNAWLRAYMEAHT